MIIDNGFILISALVLYLLGTTLAYYSKVRWVHMASGLLWFIPMVMIENIFIVVFSIIMFIFSIILAFYNDSESEF